MADLEAIVFLQAEFLCPPGKPAGMGRINGV
jgi:hypothetical protein